MSLEVEGRDDLLHQIGKEVIYKSHKKKIEDMAGWEETPFASGIEIPRSVPCASCSTKSSNKQCKHSCCKKYCLDKQAQGQEACKAHKKVIVATTPATAGTSSNHKDSSFEDSSQGSLLRRRRLPLMSSKLYSTTE
jgi:hypothetical protein